MPNLYRSQCGFFAAGPSLAPRIEESDEDDEEEEQVEHEDVDEEEDDSDDNSVGDARTCTPGSEFTLSARMLLKYHISVHYWKCLLECYIYMNKERAHLARENLSLYAG